MDQAIALLANAGGIAKDVGAQMGPQVSSAMFCWSHEPQPDMPDIWVALAAWSKDAIAFGTAAACAAAKAKTASHSMPSDRLNGNPNIGRQDMRLKGRCPRFRLHIRASDRKISDRKISDSI